MKINNKPQRTRNSQRKTRIDIKNPIETTDEHR